MNVAQPTDAELVAETLSGNRDAFTQIVARYQSLICALAYSATGDLKLSEDLAHGQLAFAAQVNTPVARQFFASNLFCREALFVLVDHHWLWLNLFWILPFAVLWWVTTRSKTTISSEP